MAKFNTASSGASWANQKIVDPMIEWTGNQTINDPTTWGADHSIHKIAMNGSIISIRDQSIIPSVFVHSITINKEEMIGNRTIYNRMIDTTRRITTITRRIRSMIPWTWNDRTRMNAIRTTALSANTIAINHWIRNQIIIHSASVHSIASNESSKNRAIDETSKITTRTRRTQAMIATNRWTLNKDATMAMKALLSQTKIAMKPWTPSDRINATRTRSITETSSNCSMKLSFYSESPTQSIRSLIHPSIDQSIHLNFLVCLLVVSWSWSRISNCNGFQACNDKSSNLISLLCDEFLIVYIEQVSMNLPLFSYTTPLSRINQMAALSWRIHSINRSMDESLTNRHIVCYMD